MFSRILIPTDGSWLSSMAVEKGLELARDANASVTIITVTEPFHIITADPEQFAAREMTTRNTRAWRPRNPSQVPS